MGFDLEVLDKVVEGYVATRQASGPKRALVTLRFEVYCGIGHRCAGETFGRIRHIAMCYAKMCRMMSHPRSGIEIPLALSTICLCSGGIYVAAHTADPDSDPFIFLLLMAVNALFMIMYIVREMGRKWCHFHTLAAIYDELAERAAAEKSSAESSGADPGGQQSGTLVGQSPGRELKNEAAWPAQLPFPPEIR